jgi:hypothetical protein
MKRNVSFFIFIALVITGLAFIARHIDRTARENRILKQVIKRLEADSRIAEVLVTDVAFDERTSRGSTTIKFLEYDSEGQPMEPRYFTFRGNIIQFQSLVIRFDDAFVAKNDPLRGKSIYLFWKVFMLDGPRTQEFEIGKVDQVPQGYQCEKGRHPFEEALWRRFWAYALNADIAKKGGVKNAQIEAPGTLFVPGTLYTIKIEHDGGMRIDAKALPAILKGERIFSEHRSAAPIR